LRRRRQALLAALKGPAAASPAAGKAPLAAAAGHGHVGSPNPLFAGPPHEVQQVQLQEQLQVQLQEPQQHLQQQQPLAPELPNCVALDFGPINPLFAPRARSGAAPTDAALPVEAPAPPPSAAAAPPSTLLAHTRAASNSASLTPSSTAPSHTWMGREALDGTVTPPPPRPAPSASTSPSLLTTPVTSVAAAPAAHCSAATPENSVPRCLHRAAELGLPAAPMHCSTSSSPRKNRRGNSTLREEMKLYTAACTMPRRAPMSSRRVRAEWAGGAGLACRALSTPERVVGMRAAG
jgi:hypothetical protein